MDMSKLKIEIQDDGSLKTNAREVLGSEEEILAVLEMLAGEVGGALTVEAHAPGVHHHHHGHGRGHGHSHG